MSHSHIEPRQQVLASPRRWSSAPRRVAVLGGTTTLADCVHALSYLVRPHRLARGSMIAAYETAFAREIGVRYAYSFASGRVGLYTLLAALDIGSGDEVLLQVPTHIVVPNAIRYHGARPIFVDCDAATFNMNLDMAERRITSRTRAIVVQHTFGIPADLDAVRVLAERYQIEIIEDCVHALGATYAGRPVGSFGRAAFFSTEETKTISSTMGGVVVTDDPALAARLKSIQDQSPWPPRRVIAGYILKFVVYGLLTQPHLHAFIRPLYELLGRRHPLPKATAPEEMQGGRPTSYLQRLSNAQAALVLRQLERLQQNIAHRQRISDIYRSKLTERGFRSPRHPAQAGPALARYPVAVADRAAAIKRAAHRAVLGTWFTSVVEEALSPSHAAYEPGSCPVAEALAQHLVNLPTHPRTSVADAEALVEALAHGASATLPFTIEKAQVQELCTT